MIRLEARVAGKRWSALAPALLTWEIESIAGWIERFAAGELRRGAVWSGMEPNLEFGVVAGTQEPRRLRVRFSHEFRPEGFPAFTPFQVEFGVTSDALRQFAMGLRAQLERYPILLGPGR